MLIRPEEEQPVFQYRAANAAAELIALQRILRRCEEVSRIETAVSQKLERTAMQRIRSRARDNIDDPAAGIPVLGAEITGLQIEFLNRIGIGERDVDVQIGIVVADTVQLIVHLSHAGPVHAGRLLVRIHTAVPADPAPVAAQIHRTGGQEDQPLRQSPVQRQFDNLFLIDQLPNRPCSRIHKFGTGLDSDFLGNLSDFERNILGGLLIYRKRNSSLLIRREAFFVSRELIVANRKSREQKRAVVARLSL